MVSGLWFQSLQFEKRQVLAGIKAMPPAWVYVSAPLNLGASGALWHRAYLLKRRLWALMTWGDARGSERSLERGRDAQARTRGAT
jgi:hypothetical protein